MFAGLAATCAVAFQQQPAPEACTPSEACSYTYTGQNMEGADVSVTASGFCNAAGVCLGNGAVCSNDDQCYNYCGATTGTCGGAGATCYSQSTDAGFVTCNSPGYVCSVDCDDENFGNCPEAGTCLFAASQAAARFRKTRRDEVDTRAQVLQMKLRRAAVKVAQAGDELVA